jgi:hypothetical protein
MVIVDHVYGYGYGYGYGYAVSLLSFLI